MAEGWPEGCNREWAGIGTRNPGKLRGTCVGHKIYIVMKTWKNEM